MAKWGQERKIEMRKDERKREVKKHILHEKLSKGREAESPMMFPFPSLMCPGGSAHHLIFLGHDLWICKLCLQPKYQASQLDKLITLRNMISKYGLDVVYSRVVTASPELTAAMIRIGSIRDDNIHLISAGSADMDMLIQTVRREVELIFSGPIETLVECRDPDKAAYRKFSNKFGR